MYQDQNNLGPIGIKFLVKLEIPSLKSIVLSIITIIQHNAIFKTKESEIYRNIIGATLEMC